MVIPVNEPRLGARELELVTECIKSGWISSAGSYIERFEDSWARYCGRRYGVAVSSGTTALQLAVRALGIGPGDEVILPSFTIISCVLAIVDAGAVPVVVDSDPHTWTLDVERVAARISPKTKAIMPVHIFGHPVDMDPLQELASRHRLRVIEDAAEAHGAEYHVRRGSKQGWTRCGAFGDVSCFSFYANKILTTGEGGMLVTDDPAIAERARSLRNLCFQKDRRFLHRELGYNFRITNLQAAIGCAQLESIDERVRRKREIGARYLDRLRGLERITLPVERPWAKSVYWMFGMVLDSKDELDAVKLALRLKERGIETRPFFLGMHAQPVLHERGLFRTERCPVADHLAAKGLYLPSGLTLTDPQIDEIASGVREVMT